MLLIIVMLIAAPKFMNSIPKRMIIETENKVSTRRSSRNTVTLTADSDLVVSISTNILDEPLTNHVDKENRDRK